MLPLAFRHPAAITQLQTEYIPDSNTNFVYIESQTLFPNLGYRSRPIQVDLEESPWLPMPMQKLLCMPSTRPMATPKMHCPL